MLGKWPLQQPRGCWEGAADAERVKSSVVWSQVLPQNGLIDGSLIVLFISNFLCMGVLHASI